MKTNVLRREAPLPLLAACVLLLLAPGCGVLGSDRGEQAATVEPPPNPSEAADTSDDFVIAAPAIGTVVLQVEPAIMQVTNEQTAIERSNQPFTVPAWVGSEDIITTVDGESLDPESSLAQVLEDQRPGEAFTMSVLCNGKP